jgi:hypothetical protein
MLRITNTGYRFHRECQPWATSGRRVAGAPSKPQDKNVCASVLNAENHAALAGTATVPKAPGTNLSFETADAGRAPSLHWAGLILQQLSFLFVLLRGA